MRNKPKKKKQQQHHLAKQIRRRERERERKQKRNGRCVCGAIININLGNEERLDGGREALAGRLASRDTLQRTLHDKAR